jgi:hypothetical protein
MMRRLFLFALALVAGCRYENRTSIAITGRASPSSSTECTFTGGGRTLLGPGTLDVSFGSLTYSTVVYVTNNLADPVADSPEASTDAKAWRAEAVRVRLNPPDYTGTFDASPALLPVTGENVLPLDGQVTPPGAKTAQWVDVVSPALGQIIAGGLTSAQQRVVVGITLQGHTLDGASLESGEWFFPIDVCNGCLLPTSDCPAPNVLAPSNCFGLAQDSVPVCECAGGRTLCGLACIDTSSDEENCGECGTACTLGQACTNGTCCQSGLTGCNDRCVDILIDEANCGACGIACAAGQTCTNGTCG